MFHKKCSILPKYQKINQKSSYEWVQMIKRATWVKTLGLSLVLYVIKLHLACLKHLYLFPPGSISFFGLSGNCPASCRSLPRPPSRSANNLNHHFFNIHFMSEMKIFFFCLCNKYPSMYLHKGCSFKISSCYSLTKKRKF